MKNIGRNSYVLGQINLVEKQDELFWPGDSLFPAVIPIKPVVADTSLNVVNYAKSQASGVDASISANIASKTGDLIVIETAYADNADSTNWNVSNTGTAITWTKKVETNTATQCKVVVWTGVAGAIPPQAVTVTSTAGAVITAAKVLNVYVARNAGTDIVNIFSGTAATNVSQAVSPTTANSFVGGFFADWLQSNSFSAGANTQLARVEDISGQLTVGVFNELPNPLTSNATVTLNANSSGTGKIAWVVFEIPLSSAGQLGLCALITKLPVSNSGTTFSKSSGSGNSELTNFTHSVISVKSSNSSVLTAVQVRSLVSSARLTLNVAGVVLKSVFSGVSTRISTAIASERVGFFSQNLFLKVGGSNTIQQSTLRNSDLGIKTNVASVTQKLLIRFISLASALGLSATGSASQLSKVGTSLSSTRISLGSASQRSLLLQLITNLKVGVNTVLQKVTIRTTENSIKIPIVSVISKAATKNAIAYTRISTATIQTLLKTRGQVNYVKVGVGPIITVLNQRNLNSSGKVTVVIVSSADMALKIRQTVLSNKIVNIGVIQQIEYRSLDSTSKTVIGSALIALGLDTITEASAKAAVITDLCTGSRILSIVDLANRFENEIPVFNLCGGRDRFEFEETNAMQELAKRGLI